MSQRKQANMIRCQKMLEGKAKKQREREEVIQRQEERQREEEKQRKERQQQIEWMRQGNQRSSTVSYVYRLIGG